MTSVRLLIRMIIAAAVLSAAPASAYKVEIAQGTGTELRWTSLPMKFNIHQMAAPGVGASATYDAVRAAYQTWTNVSCSYYASKDMGVVNMPTGDENDSVNTNVWRSSWPSSYGQNALGITHTIYDPYSGKILDADTHYNPNYTWAVNGSPSAIDVQSVATHEIGHQLGLDHSQYQDATMFYATGAGDTSQRSLHSDDIAGICYLYPSGSSPPPECTVAQDCAPSETCQNGKCVTAAAKGYGSPCNSGNDCQSNLCLQYGTNTFCSQMCDGNPCPNGDKCLPLQGGGSACLPGSAAMGTKLLGQPCQSDLDCKSEICVSVPGSGYLCSQKCTLSPDNCPSGFYCANSTAGGLCIPGGEPPPPPPPKKKLGEACTAPSDCESNICASVSGSLVCVRWCNDTDNPCPQGFICVPASTKMACIRDSSQPLPPTKGKLGADCTDSADCDSKICGDAGGRRFCTELCDPNAGCSVAGFDCVPAGADKYACTPAVVDGGGGGCSIGPDGRSARWLLLLFLLFLLGDRLRPARRRNR